MSSRRELCHARSCHRLGDFQAIELAKATKSLCQIIAVIYLIDLVVSKIACLQQSWTVAASTSGVVGSIAISAIAGWPFDSTSSKGCGYNFSNCGRVI